MMKKMALVLGAAAVALSPILVSIETGFTRSNNSAGTDMVAACRHTYLEDSATISCTPNAVPGDDYQLTEQEVAEPGFNGVRMHEHRSHAGGHAGHR